MIVLLCLLTAMLHIPETTQRSLVNPCSERNDPTCQENQEIITEDELGLEPYSSYIAYPRTHKHGAYTNSKTRVKKYKSNAVNDRPAKKLFLWIPIILAGTQIIKAVIHKVEEKVKG